MMKPEAYKQKSKIGNDTWFSSKPTDAPGVVEQTALYSGEEIHAAVVEACKRFGFVNYATAIANCVLSAGK